MTIIGDSIALAASHEILTQLPGTIIDAAVSRAAASAPAITQK
ncbi:hypothetical protein RQN30_04885 [Arcanobacterium hippocoleae]